MPPKLEKQFFAQEDKAFLESKQNLKRQNNLDTIIKNSLAEQLKKMAVRQRNRDDIKYEVLVDFVDKLKNQPFLPVFQKLSPAHKHAIITRLENEARHLGGQIPYEFIKKLEQDLYGVIDLDGEPMIDFNKKAELEKQLQDKNSRLKDGLKNKKSPKIF